MPYIVIDDDEDKITAILSLCWYSLLHYTISYISDLQSLIIIFNSFCPKKLFNKMYATAAFSANIGAMKYCQISHLLYSRWHTFYLATIITMVYLLICLQHYNWLHLNLDWFISLRHHEGYMTNKVCSTAVLSLLYLAEHCWPLCIRGVSSWARSKHEAARWMLSGAWVGLNRSLIVMYKVVQAPIAPYFILSICNGIWPSNLLQCIWFHMV